MCKFSVFLFETLKMDGIKTLLVRWYEHFLIDIADRRVDTWFLMDRPYWIILILIAYLIFVIKLGPAFMKNRRPLDLKYPLRAYNLFQILISVYLLYKGYLLSFRENYRWYCDEMDYSYNERAIGMLRLSYIYFLVKLIDLLDTFFFILRKKFNQVTILHIYHHSVMPFVIWITTKYYGGGTLGVVVPVNSFIHVVMYTYYLLAAMGPQIQKYLWWKKYLTILQLIQFAYLLTVFTASLVVGCDFPQFPIYVSLTNGIIQFSLFTNFYIKSYLRSAKSKKFVEKEN